MDPQEGAPGVPSSPPPPSTSGSSSTALQAPGADKKKNDTFLSSAPRDVGEGLKEGMKSMALGVGAGVAGLIGMPIMGAQQEGMSGFFKGLGAGVLGAVVLPTVGVFNGVVEIAGGLANTPEAISSKLEGRVWDHVQKKWVIYNLSEEATRVFQEEEDDKKAEAAAAAAAAAAATNTHTHTPGGASGGKKVKDTKFYDLLSLPPTATNEEIKKAYYKQARVCHPDRNPDDAEAHAKFQALSQAYQVLSNDQLRAAYDKEGQDSASLQDQPSVDPAMFFTVLFGSERFEPYVGTLKLSRMVEGFGDIMKQMNEASTDNPDTDTDTPTPTPTPDLSAQFDANSSEKTLKIQNLREVKCALHLVECLRPFTDRQTDTHTPEGTEGEGETDTETHTHTHRQTEAFHQWMLEEATTLAKGTFGPQMLCELGWVYENAGREYLGWKDSVWGLEGMWEKISREAKGLGRRAEVAGATLGALKAAKAVSDSVGREEEKKRKKQLGGQVQTPTQTQAQEGVGVGGGSGGSGVSGATSSSSAAAASPKTQAERHTHTEGQGEGGGGGEGGKEGEGKKEGEGEGGEASEDEMAMLNASIPAFIHVMWKMSQLDIQKTASKACKKILRDHSVTEPVRRKRAQALILLGAHFKNVGKQAMAALEAQGGGVKLDAKHLEQVMMEVVAHSQGQEL